MKQLKVLPDFKRLTCWSFKMVISETKMESLLKAPKLRQLKELLLFVHLLPFWLIWPCSCEFRAYSTICLSVGWLVACFVKPLFWAAAPKGSMTYAFTHMENFLLAIRISALRLHLGFKAGIWALRQGF